MLEARAALEVKLAELAVANATEPDLRDIIRHCEQLKPDLSSDVFERCDRMFHRSIALATDNELLIGCFYLLNIARDNREWLKLKRNSPPEQREIVPLEHQAICSAIFDRDIELSNTATLEHIIKVRMNLLGY